MANFCSRTLGAGIIAANAYKSSSVWPLARVFVDIALHRRGPDELPASPFLFGALIALDVATGFASLWTAGNLDAGSATWLLVATVFYLAYAFVALHLFGHDRRYVQTATALLGTDILITVAGMPVDLWARVSPGSPDEFSMPALLALLQLLWWLDVGGFILSRALSRPYFVGVLFMIVYFLTSLGIGRFLLLPAS